MQYLAAENSVLALHWVSTANGEELGRVEVFKYMGRLLAYDNIDTKVMRANFKKV